MDICDGCSTRPWGLLTPRASCCLEVDLRCLLVVPSVVARALLAVAIVDRVFEGERPSTGDARSVQSAERLGLFGGHLPLSLELANHTGCVLEVHIRVGAFTFDHETLGVRVTRTMHSDLDLEDLAGLRVPVHPTLKVGFRGGSRGDRPRSGGLCDRLGV